MKKVTYITIKKREEAYQVWDGRSVIIREMALGSTIVYPQLPKGVAYPSYDLKDDYVLAKVKTLHEGVLWSRFNYMNYSVVSLPPIPSAINHLEAT